MGPEQKALTVSEYVWLTDTIADVQIIAANAEAATLYGYDRPEQLIGRYLSQTLPKEDMLRGCLYSLARQRGIDSGSGRALELAPASPLLHQPRLARQSSSASDLASGEPETS